jgi:pimeloyl-ACP methyl ester carboxylesterase
MSPDASSSSSSTSSTSSTSGVTVVLVHGAWHGAWCWAGLQAELDRRGVPSYAVDLPGHGVSTQPAGGLADHVAHVDAVLARLVDSRAVTGPVVLVGHSYGGAVVAGVTLPDGLVDAAVFVAAYAPLAGECVNDIVRAHRSADTALADAMLFHEDGCSTLDPAGAATALYGESPDLARRAAVARLGPHRMTTFREPLATSLLGSVPTLYVRCSLDRAVPLSQQDACAERCDEVVTLDADHSPFLSAVDDLASIIERVALEGVALEGAGR